MKKRMLVALLLLFLIILTIFAHNYFRDLKKKSAFNYVEAIENENIEDLSLSVYYYKSGFDIYYRNPLTKEQLIQVCENNGDNDSFGISSFRGDELLTFVKDVPIISIENLDSLSNNSTYFPYIYYVLKSEKNGVLLEVELAGEKRIVVNGFSIESKERFVFFEAVLPYLSDENVRSDVEEYLSFF